MNRFILQSGIHRLGLKRFLILLGMLAAWLLSLNAVTVAELSDNAGITFSEVRSFVAAIEKVANRKNFSALKTFYAPDASLFAYRNGQAYNLTYQDLDASLRANTRMIKSYKQTNKIDGIQTHGIRAEVKMTTREDAILKNGTHETAFSKIMLTLEKRGGEIYIIKELDKITSKTSK